MGTMVEPEEVTKRLPRHLLKLGWSAAIEDICWLACPEWGYLRTMGGWELVLCERHIEELESTAEHGYSGCEPPKDGGAEMVVDFDESTNDAGQIVRTEILEDWWPWQLTEQPSE